MTFQCQLSSNILLKLQHFHTLEIMLEIENFNIFRYGPKPPCQTPVQRCDTQLATTHVGIGTCLVPHETGVDLTQCPAIGRRPSNQHQQPAVRRDLHLRNWENMYRCPVFITSERGPTFVTQVHLDCIPRADRNGMGGAS